MKRRGLTPLVTLSHYTLPPWLHDAKACHQDLETCAHRGWLDKKRAVREFVKYAAFAAQEFGEDVDLWATLNQPFALLLAGYVSPTEDRTNPPGLAMKWDAAKTVLLAMIEGHARAYDAIHEFDGQDADGDGRAARVGLGFNVMGLEVEGQDWPSLPDLSPLTTFDPFTIDFLDWYPCGIYEAVATAASYQVPVIVTECGVSDPEGDETGSRFVAEHLMWLSRAIRDGYPVESFFYWSLLDNYEWNHGMNMKFGLYAIEPLDPHKKRRAKASAATYAQTVAQNGIPQDHVSKYLQEAETRRFAAKQ